MVKKAFTLIELMIVVAVIAILALVAVSQYSLYIERARSASAQALLHNLALAQMTLKTVPGHKDFLPVDGVAFLPNITNLAEYGFRPDPTVGFAAMPFTSQPEGGFVLFGVHASLNSKIFVYNFIPNAGVRPFDPAADYVTVLPTTLTVFTWDNSTVSAVAILDINATSGLVTSVTPI